MIKSVRWIIQRFVERAVPLVGNLFSVELQSLHALGLAEQQSQLEEAARRFEAEGKPDIAAALRKRAEQLDADANSDEAVRIAQHIAQPLQSFLPTATGEPTGMDALPTPSQPKPPNKRKRRTPPRIDPLDLPSNPSCD